MASYKMDKLIRKWAYRPPQTRVSRPLLYCVSIVFDSKKFTNILQHRVNCSMKQTQRRSFTVCRSYEHSFDEDWYHARIKIVVFIIRY